MIGKKDDEMGTTEKGIVVIRLTRRRIARERKKSIRGNDLLQPGLLGSMRTLESSHVMPYNPVQASSLSLE